VIGRQKIAGVGVGIDIVQESAGTEVRSRVRKGGRNGEKDPSDGVAGGLIDREAHYILFAGEQCGDPAVTRCIRLPDRRIETGVAVEVRNLVDRQSNVTLSCRIEILNVYAVARSSSGPESTVAIRTFSAISVGVTRGAANHDARTVLEIELREVDADGLRGGGLETKRPQRAAVGQRRPRSARGRRDRSAGNRTIDPEAKGNAGLCGARRVFGQQRRRVQDAQSHRS
jgi:hypothetical protein